MELSNPQKSIGATTAKISFLVFLFFIIFGTTLPFKERAIKADDIVSSNIINQVVFSFLLLLSSTVLIGQRTKLMIIIKREKYLFLFLTWCTLSLFWSDFSFISLKRLLQIFATVTVSLAVLIHTVSSEEILKYFKWILFVYIFLTVLSILFLPQAIDPIFGTWRGLADHKNQLGQISLVSTIIWFYAFKWNKLKSNVIPILMMLISVVLLIGSYSYTSIITFCVLLMLSLLMYIVKRLNKKRLGGFFSVTVVVSFIGIMVSIICLWPEILTGLPERLGKDSTFSGRTYLWTDIFNELKKYIFWGCGFGGFWVNENMNLLLLYEQYTWLPRQAHMGYLDIINETGLVGLFLFVLIIIHYFKNLVYVNERFFGTGLIVATLIINFQETTLFRARSLTGSLFIFCYLAIYGKLFLQDDSSRSPQLKNV